MRISSNTAPSQAGLKSLAANGKLKAVDLVRKNGAQSWCRAETIKGLFDEKVRNQPAVPPMPAAHVPPPATSSEAPQPVDFWLPAAPITSPGSSEAPLPPSFRRRPVSARIRWLGPGAGLKLVMIGGVIGLCMLSFVAGIVFQAVRSPMVVPDLKAMVRVPAVPNLGEAMLRRGTYVTTTKVLLLQFEVADIAANGSLLTGLLSQKQDPLLIGLHHGSKHSVLDEGTRLEIIKTDFEHTPAHFCRVCDGPQEGKKGWIVDRWVTPSL